MVKDKLPKKWENVAKWEYMSFFLYTVDIALDYMIKEGHSHPQSIEPDEWRQILQEMREGFKLAQQRIDYKELTKEQEKKIERSLNLFKKWFFHMWD